MIAETIFYEKIMPKFGYFKLLRNIKLETVKNLTRGRSDCINSRKFSRNKTNFSRKQLQISIHYKSNSLTVIYLGIAGFCPGRALVPFAHRNSRGRKKPKWKGLRARIIFLTKRRQIPTSSTTWC